MLTTKLKSKKGKNDDTKTSNAFGIRWLGI